MNAPTYASSIKEPPKRTLGRSGVAIGPLGLGGSGLGNLYRAIDDAAATDTIRAACDVGIDFIDTAPFYGFGLSERRVGAALRGIRSKVSLSTKVGRVLVPTTRVSASPSRDGFMSSEPFEPRFDYTYDGVMRSFESSLERLGASGVDVLLCHDLGEMTHGSAHGSHTRDFLTGGYRAMQRLREEGSVGAIGLGVNECEICMTLLAKCDFDCLLLAGRYTLLEQPALNTLLPMCEQRAVSIIVGGPFNSGILAAARDDAPYNYMTPPTAIVGRVRRIASICKEHGTPIQAAALQFPLAHPQVAAVIPGCGSAQEVRRARDWMDVPISADLWRALREADLLHPEAPVPS